MSEDDVNHVSVIVGGRNTGKTDFSKGLLRASPLPKSLIVEIKHNQRWLDMKSWDYPKGEYEKIGVMDIDNLARWKTGRYILFDRDTKKVFAAVSDHVYNTCVIFDDATKFIDFRKKLQEDALNFILDTKQQNVNLHLCFHSLRVVPVEILEHIDYFTIFKNGFSSKIPNHVKTKYPEEVIIAHNEVWNDPDPHANITLDMRI